MTGAAIALGFGFGAIVGGYGALVRAPDGASGDIGCIVMLAGLVLAVVSLSIMVLS